MRWERREMLHRQLLGAWSALSASPMQSANEAHTIWLVRLRPPMVVAVQVRNQLGIQQGVLNLFTPR